MDEVWLLSAVMQLFAFMFFTSHLW